MPFLLTSTTPCYVLYHHLLAAASGIYRLQMAWNVLLNMSWGKGFGPDTVNFRLILPIFKRL